MYLNVSKTIEETIKTMDDRYDLCAPTIRELLVMEANDFERNMNFFLIGYAQGRKATLKELKKNRKQE